MLESNRYSDDREIKMEEEIELGVWARFLISQDNYFLQQAALYLQNVCVTVVLDSSQSLNRPSGTLDEATSCLNWARCFQRSENDALFELGRCMEQWVHS